MSGLGDGSELPLLLPRHGSALQEIAALDVGGGGGGGSAKGEEAKRVLTPDPSTRSQASSPRTGGRVDQRGCICGESRPPRCTRGRRVQAFWSRTRSTWSSAWGRSRSYRPGCCSGRPGPNVIRARSPIVKDFIPHLGGATVPERVRRAAGRAGPGGLGIGAVAGPITPTKTSASWTYSCFGVHHLGPRGLCRASLTLPGWGGRARLFHFLSLVRHGGSSASALL